MIIVLAKAIPKNEEACAKIVEFAQDLIENTKKEEGNIDYNLYSNTADGTLLFVHQEKKKIRNTRKTGKKYFQVLVIILAFESRQKVF